MQPPKGKWQNSHAIFATILHVFWEMKVSVGVKKIAEDQWATAASCIV